MHRRSFGRRGRGGRGWNRNQRHNHHQNRPNQFRSNAPVEQLTESEVGITEYISKLDGFSGVIKARFSDFHVNEIDLDGNVAKYTENNLPPEFVIPKAQEPPKDCPIEDVTQAQWDQVLDMMGKGETSVVNLDVTQYDKEKRSALHKKIKDIFHEKIVSSTVAKDDKKFIELKKYGKGGDRKNRQFTEWPKNLGEYVHFILYKECLDTMDAVLKISDALRLPAAAFSYAGVKDRRAKTTQWMSVRKVQPWKLLHKTKIYHSVRIGNIQFKDKPLKLGHLSGNRFKVALRNITVDDDIINCALESLMEHGYINYYGLQRFGNDKEVPTFEIGVRLLQGNWKEACRLILKPKKNEDTTSEITQAKKIYHETSDARKACIKLNSSYNYSIESKLLNGLAKSGKNDYITSLENLPRNTRLLYIHAFQSLVWNQVVSKRIKEFGLKPAVGDLVLVDQASSSEETVASTTGDRNGMEVDNDPKNTECKSADKNPVGGSNETENIQEGTEEDVDETEKCLQIVKVLTESDLQNYTIYDIVLPLPGYDITYPNNTLKEFYKEILGKYGLELEMRKQSVKTYNLCGSYRKIVLKPKELTWKTIRYNDPNDTLIRSDFEEILKHPEPKNPEDGKYKGLVVTFDLSSSSYATMVLREILKIDTSGQAQSKLNDYHESEEIKTEDTADSTMFTGNSLLKDKDKFEAFKKAIFDTSEPEEPLKRKPEDEVSVSPKKPKLEEPEKESGIKIQASLV